MNNLLIKSTLHTPDIKRSYGEVDLNFCDAPLNCEHPKFILNPDLNNLVSKHRRVLFCDRLIEYPKVWHSYFALDKRIFHDYISLLTLDNYQQHGVIDDDGRIYPLYILVRCGHCDGCKYSKINSFVQRAKYEAFCYDYQPLFVTLTYDNKWYPESGISKRDCQLFLKRFRVNLVRSGILSKIRYILVSEYGKRTQRGHYHAIIYGLPLRTDRDTMDIERILERSWSKGFCMSRKINLTDDRAFYYTAKYICKQRDSERPTFMLSSRGHGGIGSKFFDSLKDEMRKYPSNTEVLTRNPFSDKVEKVFLNKYALDRIFPTYSRSVPRELRNALCDFAFSYYQLRFRDPSILPFYQGYKDDIDRFYKGVIHYPSDIVSLFQVPTRLWYKYDSECTSRMEHAYKIAMKYKDDIDTFMYASSIHQKRDLYLSNLFRHPHIIDLSKVKHAYSTLFNRSIDVI